jgi:hypothetical protein
VTRCPHCHKPCNESDLVDEVVPDDTQRKKCLALGHTLITHPEDDFFYGRDGCLTCDKWFNEPRLKN